MPLPALMAEAVLLVPIRETLVWAQYVPRQFAGRFPMKGSQMLDHLSEAEIRERDDDIRRSPPRLPRLPVGERTLQQPEWLDRMSGVVVCGVRKLREDKAALENLVRHAELCRARVEEGDLGLLAR
jgi:hypothetical protein